MDAIVERKHEKYERLIRKASTVTTSSKTA